MLTKLSPQHKLIAHMLAIGYTQPYIQSSTEISRQTLYNLKKEEVFNKQVAEYEAEYHRQITTSVVKARTKLEEAILEAVNVKIELMRQDDNLNVKNNAATDILEMAGIKKKLDDAKGKEGSGHLYLTDTEDSSIPDDIPAEEMHLFLDDIITEDDFIKDE